MSAIRNIIFDLGGVILDLDFSRTINAFTELGVAEFESIFNPPQQSPLFDRFEKGLISDEEFFLSLKEQLNLSQPISELEQAWNAMLLGIPNHRLQLLRDYKLRYQTFLLSNTNTSHIKSFANDLPNGYGQNHWEPYFHRAYYSCDINLSKPDPEIFCFVLENDGLIPEETLFIDDTLINLQSAQRLGIQTLHLPRGEEFAELLDRFLAMPQ